jgi:hypothetical protein
MAQAELSSYFFVCFSAWTIAKVAMIVATPSMYIYEIGPLRKNKVEFKEESRVQGGK